jgi:hypothetical protein
MQINRLPPKAGYIWIRQGIWLFKQNPFTFLMLVFLYIFIMQLSMFIPLVGIIVVLVFNPCISVGFLTAAQRVILKQTVKPSIYITAIRELSPTLRIRLLKLGGLYTAFVLFISLVSSQFIDVEKIMPLLTSGEITGPDLIQEMYYAMIVAVVLYLPVAMLMWFAPQLVAWQNCSIRKAIFGSWLGFWFNKGPFAVYLVTWAIVLTAVPLFVGGIFESLGIKQYASYLITPFSMLAITVFYCSFYAIWKGCFVDVTPSTSKTMDNTTVA